MHLIKGIIGLAIIAIIAWIVYDYDSAKDVEQNTDKDATENAEKITKDGAKSPEMNAADGIIEKAEEKPAEETKPAKKPMYKWKDSFGTLHYTDDPDSIPQKYRKRAKRVDLPELNVVDEKTAQKMMLLAKGNMKITVPPRVTRSKGIQLYMTKWCPNCKKMINLLKSLDVPFAELDIEKDARIMQTLLDITGGQPSVPVVIIGGKTIIGFREDEIIRTVKILEAQE